MLTPFRVSRSFRTAVDATANVQAVAAMFGIGIVDDISVELYKQLEVKLGPGQIVYITGDSGAGKSCLLADLRKQVLAHKDFSVAPELLSDAGDQPVVDQFPLWSLDQACELLNYVGIAEAFIYLRKPSQLSDGQRYRFRLAYAIYLAETTRDKRTPVILVDEFLAVLDRETARNVAYQIRRVASKYKICFAVATTHADMVQDLQPNLTITLRLNLPPELAARPLAGV